MAPIPTTSSSTLQLDSEHPSASLSQHLLDGAPASPFHPTFARVDREAAAEEDVMLRPAGSPAASTKGHSSEAVALAPPPLRKPSVGRQAGSVGLGSLVLSGTVGATASVTTMALVSICLHSVPLAHVTWPLAGAIMGAWGLAFLAATATRFVLARRYQQRGLSKNELSVYRAASYVQAASVGGIAGALVVPIMHATLLKDVFYPIVRIVGAGTLGILLGMTATKLLGKRRKAFSTTVTAAPSEAINGAASTSTKNA